MVKVIKPVFFKPPEFSPKEFYEKRNTILIVRQMGGLGDILMHRFMFEDMKAMHPDLKIHFACPAQYHDVVRDHPFIDEVLDSATVDPKSYVVAYDTSTACMRYEVTNYPSPQKHRSDIWANHCGAALVRHNGHLKVSEEAACAVQDIIASLPRPLALFTPVTAMEVRTLTPDIMEWVVGELRAKGCTVISCHTKNIPTLSRLNVPIVTGLALQEIVALHAAMDYVVSADTSHFHIAGMLGKPLTGIFAMTDGNVYGKYFDFILVQKHRDNGDWACGPCYDWTRCPKSQTIPKPCMSEITQDMVTEGIKKMLDRRPIERANN